MGQFDKSNPFLARIKERYLLTKPGSSKEAYHIVLDISGSDLKFKVGDSIGILPQNDPLLIDAALERLQKPGHELIVDSRTSQEMSLKSFLTHRVNLSEFTTPSAYRPLLPRLYSIASSPKASPDEIHLTVVVSTYFEENRLRYGVASHFLCHLADDKTPIPLYLQPTRHFTLPEDPNAALIMIGPGTGVAPFRAFMQERTHHKNWLFFGERNRNSDFFYQEFWQTLESQNRLRLDLAFSRDQSEKVYVQHKMYEKGADLYQWIQEGAYLYVCGDKDPMAKDVEAMICHIFKEQGNHSDESARAYLKSLRLSRRYLVDVY